MVEFKARRHRLELPSTPKSEDPAVLKKAMDDMKRLVQDEFNRLATDFYDFKQTTYNAAIIPLRGVSNIAVVKDQFSVNATWELPDGDEITPTHVRVRILEISPNSWSLYTYPKTSWEFNGLTPGTQYTLQVQLVATFEATDTFVSTTRNCPSVPVLRTAESDIKAKVFTTDDGPGPPTDGGTNNEVITINFPNTQGTPGPVGGGDCWWEYKIQYKSACEWGDTGAGGAEVDGDVGDITIDTADAPFTTYPNAVFRLAYREICNGVPDDWVYAPEFMAVDYADADCLGIVKSASLSSEPFDSANVFFTPQVCQEDGSYLQIVDALTDTELIPMYPGFKCVEYIDQEWTILAADTTDYAISPTIYQSLLSGEIAAIQSLFNDSDFTFATDLYVPDNSLVLRGGTGAYPIVVVGDKIELAIIQNTTTYSVTITVPRDGGGAYVFRADGLEYATWNSIYYSHDVSEPDGRKLFVNGIQEDQSTNAIANNFDGISTNLQIYTVNDMRIRKVAVWDELVTPPLVGFRVVLAGSVAGASTVTVGNVEVGDIILAQSVEWESGSGAPSVAAPGVGSSTATFEGFTQVGFTQRFDATIDGRGDAAVYVNRVTGAGSFVIQRPSGTASANVVVLRGANQGSALAGLGRVNWAVADGSNSVTLTGIPPKRDGWAQIIFVGGQGTLNPTEYADGSEIILFSNAPTGRIVEAERYSAEGFLAAFEPGTYATGPMTIAIDVSGGVPTDFTNGGMVAWAIEYASDAQPVTTDATLDDPYTATTADTFLQWVHSFGFGGSATVPTESYGSAPTGTATLGSASNLHDNTLWYNAATDDHSFFSQISAVTGAGTIIKGRGASVGGGLVRDNSHVLLIGSSPGTVVEAVGTDTGDSGLTLVTPNFSGLGLLIIQDQEGCYWQPYGAGITDFYEEVWQIYAPGSTDGGANSAWLVECVSGQPILGAIVDGAVSADYYVALFPIS